MSDFNLKIREENEIIIIKTSGYLNNVGGEKISEVCYEMIDKGKSLFLLDLESSSNLNNILQNPLTAPVGSPSLFRVSGGKA